MSYKSGFNKKNKTYNYDHLFANIKNDIKSADISVVSQEILFYLKQKLKIIDYLDFLENLHRVYQKN